MIGGAMTKDFVSRTMAHFFYPFLARQFVWAGWLTEKRPFRFLELKKLGEYA